MQIKNFGLSHTACGLMMSLVFLSTLANAQGSICKWQDEKGKWHISSTPPNAEVQCGKARDNSLNTVPRESPTEFKDKSNMSLGESFVETVKRQKALEKKYIDGSATPAETREYELRKERWKEVDRKRESAQPLKCTRSMGAVGNVGSIGESFDCKKQP